MPLPGGSAWLIEEQNGVPVRAVLAYRESVIDRTIVVAGWSHEAYPGPADLRKLGSRMH